MTERDLWVFGYASLIWDPGFPVAERRVARLKDFARSFCMLSVHHRGTEEEPGLVLALDAHPGAACEGVAMRAEPGSEAETMGYLRERELISSAYLEQTVQVRLEDGREVAAVTYVVDRAHRQYCQLSLEEQAGRIAHAVGGRGPNDTYLFNTAQHLDELGIADEELSWLARRVRKIKAGPQ
ncbi:gamma-glutamylcyclotransferase [Ovoidimarina sediminis]|uniref:gamma-glutamylcyclotransferase n=1 Tax=Ovoidimarina sediminis TaxID=3079856 RepID=UPI00291482BB|nr:gamma-glutamylcyclotransferase [Rhodophyticola sp. MJ-SS7]MDU8943248.1 gamma-glutamylcyclotransferase [Rhodophyticola sp. MJ-SS7]